MEYCMCTFTYPTHDDSVFLQLDMDPAQVTTVFIEILTALDGETRAQAKPRQMSFKICLNQLSEISLHGMGDFSIGFFLLKPKFLHQFLTTLGCQYLVIWTHG